MPGVGPGGRGLWRRCTPRGGGGAGGALHTVTVTGPLGEPVAARWVELEGRVAAIAMSEAAGLGQVPSNRRDPTRTTTRGLGELIRLALDAGCRRVLVGLGGSATCDGGTGMAAALGVRFLDPTGREPAAVPVDEMLRAVVRIDSAGLDRRLREAKVVAACDVTNPLTGPRGAAVVYGPQKGATPEQVKRLDRGLAHLAAVLREQGGHRHRAAARARARRGGWAGGWWRSAGQSSSRGSRWCWGRFGLPSGWRCATCA